MSKIARRKIASYVADQLIAGQPRAKVLRELAAYLIDANREHEAELVVRDIEAHLLGRGIAHATVTSAAKLSANAAADITAYLRRTVGATQVELATQVDPSVIGGVRIELLGQRFDGTVKHKLDVLQTNGRY